MHGDLEGYCNPPLPFITFGADTKRVYGVNLVETFENNLCLKTFFVNFIVLRI